MKRGISELKFRVANQLHIQTWTNYRMKLIDAHTSGINIEIEN